MQRKPKFIEQVGFKILNRYCIVMCTAVASGTRSTEQDAEGNRRKLTLQRQPTLGRKHVWYQSLLHPSRSRRAERRNQELGKELG